MAASGRTRVGVYGGTFDPIHIAHLVAAVYSKAALGLDRVLLVVANEPWQKSARRDVTSAALRLEMVRAAVDGLDGIEASDAEIARGGPSYTVDTLEALRAAEPGADFVLIVGADVAAQLETWKRADALRSLASLGVVTRPGSPWPTLDAGWNVERIEIPALDISGEDLRARVAAGLPIDFLVPAGAIHFIRKHRLYIGAR